MLNLLVKKFIDETIFFKPKVQSIDNIDEEDDEAAEELELLYQDEIYELSVIFSSFLRCYKMMDKK
jgi:hypothetical protein